MDVFLYIAKKFTDKLVMPLAYVLTIFLSSCVAGTLAHFNPGHVAAEPGLATIMACSLALFVVADFSNYVTHYLQHFVPILWELHKVHHSATFLNPLTTSRMHPFGDLFDALVAGVLVGVTAGLFAFAFKLSMADIFLLIATGNTIATLVVLDPLRHSHFRISFGPLDRVLLSPHMHQLHHSSKLEHWDRNFGNKLSIWDWLFDTAYKPAKNEEIIYGLGDPEERDYDALSGAYVGPLVKMWRLATNQVGGSSYPQAYVGAEAAAGTKSFTSRVLWRKKEDLTVLDKQPTKAETGSGVAVLT